MSSEENNRDIDFKILASDLLSRSLSVVMDWFPQGKLVGKEFKLGSLRGEAGNSLSININEGVWKDFSTNESGADLISLYAAKENISQIDAAKALSHQKYAELPKHKKKTNAKNYVISKPPKDMPKPKMYVHHFGLPTMSWEYRDAAGDLMYYVSRYDPPDNKKQFVPWSWCNDTGKGKMWVMRAWPAPRPLYGLDLLAKDVDKPVLIVEGEKCADAARTITSPTYVVITWPGGGNALNEIDWSPLANRRVLIWPDADEPGIKAGQGLASRLHGVSKEVKILDVSRLLDGWDAADAVKDGWDYAEFKKWAKTVVSVWTPPLKTELVDQLPQPHPIAEPKSFSLNVTVSEDQGEDSLRCRETWLSMGLNTGRNGTPIYNSDNIHRVLINHPDFKHLVWYDEFHSKIFTKWRTGKRREWSDIDLVTLLICLQRNLGLEKITKPILEDAVTLAAHANRKNEPKDWIESLPWDGTYRCSEFLTKCFGASDDIYTKSASRNWWVAIAARIMSPGCKFDNMLVLESEQGKQKSTAFDILGGEWFMEAQEDVTRKDFFISLQGKLIVEVAELHSFSKADVYAIKRTVSCRNDRFRLPHGTYAQDFPRRCVFVGTTNELSYLDDQTGGRRFWPVKIKSANIALIHEWREQLFAEALSLFKNGEKWWIMPEVETKEAQEKRRISDEWENIVMRFMLGREYTTTSEIAVHIGIDLALLTKATQNRLGTILRQLGYENKPKREGTNVYRAWVRSGELTQMDLMHEIYQNSVGHLPNHAPQVTRPASGFSP